MIVLKCGCGMEYTREQWLKLPFVGIQKDDVECLQLRNCVCGSTRSVPMIEARSGWLGVYLQEIQRDHDHQRVRRCQTLDELDSRFSAFTGWGGSLGYPPGK